MTPHVTPKGDIAYVYMESVFLAECKISVNFGLVGILKG